MGVTRAARDGEAVSLAVRATRGSPADGSEGDYIVRARTNEVSPSEHGGI
jgi:hypothetical protein